MSDRPPVPGDSEDDLGARPHDDGGAPDSPSDDRHRVDPGLKIADADDRSTGQESEGTGGLGRDAASGAIWVTAQTWATKLTAFATMAILTRLVTPTEFGVVAAAWTVLPLIGLLSDLGFSTYIVQSKRADQRMLSTGFWFSASAGVVISAIIVAAAPVLGNILHLPAVVPVLQVMVVAVLAAVLTSVPLALLRRRMAFRLVAVQRAVGAFLSQLVAIGFAVAGTGVWALVAQSILTQLVIGVMAWRSARWRPSLQFSRKQFKEMLSFGSSVLGTDVVAMLRAWGETAIILTALGPAVLGYLSIAQRLVQIAQDLGASAVLNVSTVVFAKVRANLERLQRTYLRSLSITYTVGSPILLFVAIAAPTLIPFAFGAGWSASVPAAQALAVAGILTLGAGLDNGLFYGTGRPGVWLAYAAATDAVTVAGTAVGVHWGLRGVAVSFVVVALLATVARWFLVAHQFRIPVPVAARPLLVSVLIGVSAAAAGLGVHHVSTGLPAVAALAATGTAIVAVSIAVTRLAAPAVYMDTAHLLRLRERLSLLGARRRRS